MPDPDLVAAIFGQRDTVGTQGVYFNLRNGTFSLGEERFRIAPSYDEAGALACAAATFRGLAFMVIADSQLPPKNTWLRMWPRGWSAKLDYELSLRCT